MKKNKLSVISFILALVMSIMLVPSAMAADGVPTVAKMIPADGTKNVQTVGTTIQLKFTEELDQKKVEATGSITINNGAKVLASKLIDPKTVNVYLTSLMPNTEYVLKVTSAIQSTEGVAAEPVEKKFTTGAAQMYHQIPDSASDMSDPIWRMAYSDAGANGKSIKFVKDGDNDMLEFKADWVDAPLMHSVSVEPGVTYYARAKVKSNQNQTIRVVMYYNCTDDTEFYRVGEMWDQSLPKDTWTEVYSTFTIPMTFNTESVPSVVITAKNKGSILTIDDFQFYEVNTDEPAPVMDPGSAASDKLVTTIEEPTADLTTQKLEGLGIYTKGEYAEKATISREVFSKYMAKILEVDQIKSTANFENYTDVDEGYSGHIGTMVEMNILTANDKGELRPDAAITFSEVCRAFVVALGHQKALDEKTPIVAASNLGIRNLTGLKAASEVTYKDLNGLLDSFLKAECLYNEFGNYKTGEILETKFGVTKLKGIVEATSQTSLYNAEGIADGYVKIDGKTYKLIDSDVTEVLGMYVTYYVKEIDGEKCVLFIGDLEKNNRTLKLDAYDVLQYANNVYVYCADDQASGKRAELESDKLVIYNGRATNIYQSTDLKPTYGWVELVDNDKNGKYDVVKITDYDTYVVDSYDSATQTIRDKFENKFMTFDGSAKIIVYRDGKDSKLNAIKSGNVVTIERSMDGKRIVLNISTKTTEAEVGEIEIDDASGVRFASFYDLVHKEVKTDVKCVKGYTGNANIVAGDNGIFHIDAFGQIVAFVRGAGSWTYGYIKKARLWDEEFVRIEMFTQNNTHETIDCAENVKIDTYRTTGHDDTFNVLANSGSSDTNTAFVEPELIMYKTNSDGLIRQIKTARNNTPGDFRIIKTISSGGYIAATGLISESSKGFMHVDDETVLMRVPSDANLSDTSAYSFSIAKNTLITKTTAFTAYSLSDDRLTADMLLVKGKEVWNQDQRWQGIVTGIKNRLDNDGEFVTVITTTSGSIEVNQSSLADVNNMTATDGTTGHTLRKGDYVGWRRRGDGYVYDMYIIFKGDTKQNLQGTGGAYPINAIKCIYGTVTHKEGNIIEITDENYDTIIYNAGKTPLYRCISELGTVEKTTADEITTTGSTQVAVFTDWEGTVNCMVIYK